MSHPIHYIKLEIHYVSKLIKSLEAHQWVKAKLYAKLRDKAHALYEYSKGVK